MFSHAHWKMAYTVGSNFVTFCCTMTANTIHTFTFTSHTKRKLRKEGKYFRTARRKNVARTHNHCCYGNATLPSLCIVFNLYVAVSDVKPSVLPREFSSRFLLHYCWATEYFGLQSTIWKYLGVHVKIRYFCPILTKFRVFIHIFLKIPNNKFHGNPSSGNRNDACRPDETCRLFSLFMPTHPKTQWQHSYISSILHIILPNVVGNNLAEDKRVDLVVVAHLLRISKNFLKSRGIRSKKLLHAQTLR
jgi:hypothetical protein